MLRTGEFPIRVKSSTGVTQTKTVSIAQEVITGGKLVVALDGSFAPGDVFSVQGKVTDPVPGQTLTLILPAGLDRVEGAAEQAVPPLPGGVKTGTTLVTWKAKVREPGKYPIRVQSSTGVTQTKTITIAQPEKTGGAFKMSLKGDIAPGKTFKVQADVANPVVGQTLKLLLPPAGLRCSSDLEQAVPQPAGEGDKIVLTWEVKVLEPGKFPVKVQSSTGVTQTKTINILSPESSAGAFTMSLKGEIAPGKTFNVVAQVTNPVPGQTLTLQLPPIGLQCGDDLIQTVPEPVGGKSQLTWEVRVNATGKFRVGVQSSTGITQAKTITIERPDDSGTFVMALEGKIQPGKEFTVLAKVTKPRPEQKLTLVLPTGMELTASPSVQPVPPLDAGETISKVAWTVRLASPLPSAKENRFSIKVESTTGVVRTKTITITGSSSGPALFGQ